jgi:hypothetical protein
VNDIRRDLVAVVPCRNEELSIATVLGDLRTIGVRDVIVALDPAGSDATARIAAEHGATVIVAGASGYDAPCLAAIAHLNERHHNGSVLFLDAGNKYVMHTIGAFLEAADPTTDIMFGVRDTQWRWHQRLGNSLFRVAVLVRYRHNLRDVSSVRLARLSVLNQLNLEDRQFSLPFQTVLHALARKMTLCYVPIRCTSSRTGTSKVSGQWRNSAKAAHQMGLSFFRVR